MGTVTYPHISGRGTHHGGCGGWSKDGRGQTGEGREGVLVGVLVLVHVLVLVKLCPQERHRPPAPLRTLNQEAVVQFLPQEIMLCKKGERGNQKGGKGGRGHKKKKGRRPVS